MTDVAALHRLLVSHAGVDLDAIAHYIADELDGDTALILLVGSDEEELTVGGMWPPRRRADETLRIPVGFGVVGLVAGNGHAVTLVDDSPRNEVHRHLLGLRDGERVSRLCVPLHGLESAKIGVVSVSRRDGRPFDEADLATAQVRADLVGLRVSAQGLLGAAEEQRRQRDRLIIQAISAQEAERRRIAGDLHDGVTQALVSLSFHLSAAQASLRDDPTPSTASERALDQVVEARRLASLAYDETRSAINGLHSLLLEDLGLVAALESLAQTVPQIDVEFRYDSADRLGDVPDHCAAVLYRIAQESLNNVVKHAEASSVLMTLRRVGDAVVLAVTDDGIGFDVSTVRGSGTPRGTHFGLHSIAERCALIGASLRIDSVEGRGTALIVEAPL